jgi:hypothetical protein
MPKIAMNEGRHKNTDEMVGISWMIPSQLSEKPVIHSMSLITQRIMIKRVGMVIA